MRFLLDSSAMIADFAPLWLLPDVKEGGTGLPEPLVPLADEIRGPQTIWRESRFCGGARPGRVRDAQGWGYARFIMLALGEGETPNYKCGRFFNR